jgi:hypothetical protein
MKEIKPDELFANLTSFLKDKGIELTDGMYSQRIRQGCDLLADAVNLTQAGLAKARAELDEKLNRMRQMIHEKTAPKKPAAESSRPKSTPPAGSASPAKKSRRIAKKPAAPRPKRKKAS